MKKIILFSLFFLISLNSLVAQNFSATEIEQGYRLDEAQQQVTFIFDESLYQLQPNKVVVTGSFRNWDQNMDDGKWMLKKKGAQWLLVLDNKDFATIAPKAEFKFRTDDGNWIDPPKVAPNQKGGNLVFMPNAIVASLKAELKNEYLVWAILSGTTALSPADFRLTDAHGKVIPIAGVLPNESNTLLIRPAEELDITRVYFLEIPDKKLSAFCSFDGWFRHLYSTKELGANIYNNTADGGTTFRLFAPRATQVRLHLCKNKDDKQAYRRVDLTRDAQGVWETELKENLHGVYYDYTIHGPDDPGNFFYDTNPVFVTDPYARVSDDTWGKARIWQKTTAAKPLKKGIPPMQDVIAYEVHVQDFTDLLPLPEKHKGTFKGMITPGLKNKRGEKIGFDYLLDLGVNVVHLLPVQEYLHFPTDDWKASFQNDPYMIEQGVSEENYQWGYRTSHAFAVESRYRTKGTEPGTERNEFRDLVQAFHNHDIAVIIDIVPNHTAENITEKESYFNFNGIDKLYYYRTKNFEHIGGYGNEVKTENRPMVQRWLIDQCLHFINEFGIDGFRVDLAGQIDEQTLKALKAAIGADKILYGEAWIASNDPAYEENPDWDWYKADAPITYFQDDSRNAYKGPVFELKNYKKDRGWPGGKFDERENVKNGLANKCADDKTPLSGISYLDIHDNFALADQFGGPDFDGRTSVDQDEYKIAVALLYTTLGPIVTHGGSEIMRSKALAPLMEVVKVTKAGVKNYMHGYRDTYNHRKANQFLWETVGQPAEGDNKNDYQNMHAFWRGMNAFRLSDYGKVFRVAEAVADDYYRWILPEQESALGYFVNDKVLILLNAGEQAFTFSNITFPEGEWRLIGNISAVDHLKGVQDDDELMRINSSKSKDVRLNGTDLKIWVRL
jgi:pullulanase